MDVYVFGLDMDNCIFEKFFKVFVGNEEYFEKKYGVVFFLNYFMIFRVKWLFCELKFIFRDRR